MQAMTAEELSARLAERARVQLACLPTPIHRLDRLSARLAGPEIWLKRDDLTGLEGGGNKTRKLEFVVADALQQGADTLVSVGALQSNHTRQTAAAAARVGLKCALLHNVWSGPNSSTKPIGNLLISDMMGATLYLDPSKREIGDEGRWADLMQQLTDAGHNAYFIPGGASEHPLGGLGYVGCAAEISAFEVSEGLRFDCVVHCTGSSSTQAGLLAGFAALGSRTEVIGVSDDWEREEKVDRVERLANETLSELRLPPTIGPRQVSVMVSDESPYGSASPATLGAIRELSESEGIAADPVYEGKALLGLMQLIRLGKLTKDKRVLLLHLGGTPAIHAYSGQLWRGPLQELAPPI